MYTEDGKTGILETITVQEDKQKNTDSINETYSNLR